MSYFLFGVIGAARPPSRENIGEGIEVSWGIAFQQAILITMLKEHGKLVSNETPFSLSLAGDDNASALVQSWPVDHQRVIARFGYTLAWLDRERAGGDAELWITEGYDTHFEESCGTSDELLVVVRDSFGPSEELPSLRLRLTR